MDYALPTKEREVVMRVKNELDALVAQAYLQGIHMMSKEMGVAQLTDFVLIGTGKKETELTPSYRQSVLEVVNECYLDITTIWRAYKVGSLDKLYVLLPQLSKIDKPKVPSNVQEYLYATVVATYLGLCKGAPHTDLKAVATLLLPKRPVVKKHVYALVERQYADFSKIEGVEDYVQDCIQLAESVQYNLLKGQY